MKKKNFDEDRKLKIVGFGASAEKFYLLSSEGKQE